MQTTIVITKKTREQLKNLGKKGESYDEIISHLIHYFQGNQKND